MLGVLVTMFCKNTKVKQTGEAILGFGVLFMGLSLMSGSMAGMKESPVIVNLLAGLDNPFLGIFVGFVVTAIIQSSSVTVSIVLLMAQQGCFLCGFVFILFWAVTLAPVLLRFWQASVGIKMPNVRQ